MNDDKPGIGGRPFTITLNTGRDGIEMYCPGIKERAKAKRSISRMKKAGHRFRDKQAYKLFFDSPSWPGWTLAKKELADYKVGIDRARMRPAHWNGRVWLDPEAQAYLEQREHEMWFGKDRELTPSEEVLKNVIQARLDMELQIGIDLTHEPDHPDNNKGSLFWIDTEAIPVTMAPEEWFKRCTEQGIGLISECDSRQIHIRTREGGMRDFHNAMVEEAKRRELAIPEQKVNMVVKYEGRPEYQELTLKKIQDAVDDINKRYPTPTDWDFNFRYASDAKRKIMLEVFMKASEALINKSVQPTGLLVGTRGGDYDGATMEDIFRNPEKYDFQPLSKRWDDEAVDRLTGYFTATNQPKFDDYGQAKEDAQPVPPATGTTTDTADGSNAD